MALRAPPLKAAEIAISSIGLGYDIAADIRLKYCKREIPDPYLIELDRDQVQDVVLPGGLCIPNVPKSIKCDKGERMRFRSDVLTFQQMSEQFNQELSLSGKIPSGLFNHMFDFSGCWQKNAADTKSLAFDGWFITLYTVALSKSQIVLRDHVKQAVPSTWDPVALARFISNFGTHIVVGVKMGGKDVVYVRQQHSSSLQPVEVQKRLKELADRRFLDVNGPYHLNSKEAYGKDKLDIKEQRLRFAGANSSSSYSAKEDIMKIFKRRGGKDNKDLSHNEWLNTVQSEPDVISMSFLPITSLLIGVLGSGFLNHAINLYLRYKPPLEELHQFLEFQLPRQWAPVYGDLPLGPQRKQQSSSSLQFTFMGPKLYVNTSMVDVGKRPVTGLRLYLEGKRSNRLAIHLQHLSSLPQILQFQDNSSSYFPQEPYDRRYYEPVQRRHFSHVYTGPVEADDDSSIVTGAQLHVRHHGLKKVLFLHLHFSTVSNAVLVKNAEWEESLNLVQKSGLISTLISTHFSMAAQKPPPRPADVNINSAVYPGGPPVPVQTPKLLKFVDTTEMMRGPQDSPGYWVVSGAKLHLRRGKISLGVKYSLLTTVLPDEEL
ncbi:MACPF domain-containing protein At4g24290-like [Elaeis guineensis]|uniref:MACPF domain-containing protein At4g24290 n=1 Tax=Elaeis guineensis var. tenera TaxID=51953 RepID=A0A6I9RR08_ELAGV|nr:MACPF domain-containing protein At4g24290 [Elaeis guineensis]XP_010930569.1 MACPF domain-containing protein At4g24290 [Elaeis guineensis]